MDDRPMTGLLALPLCFLGGLLLGLVHFSALRATAALIVGGGSALLGLVLTLGRECDVYGKGPARLHEG